MAGNEYFSSQKRVCNNSSFSNTENLLILEKSLEQNGQDWIENLNTIEQLVVTIVHRMRKHDSTIKSNFVVRRLPTYLSPFINKNDYGVVLEDFPFSLSPPKNARFRSTSPTDRPGFTNFGQLEIFNDDSFEADLETQLQNEEHESPSDEDYIGQVSARLKRSEIINSNGAYCSHEVFKRFATAFVDAYHFEMERDESKNEFFNFEEGKVQIIGPHLLFDVYESPEVKKIFTLAQPPLPMSKDTKGNCSISVNYLKSLITITYQDTEATVRPCLFYDRGYSKVNANISERLPLYHPSFLNCAESLTKGLLLIPTSFETLWTLQYWTAESHLIARFHPGSLICRVFKLYSAFCLNPINFWETLNSSFLVGLNEIENFEDSCKTDLLNTDFVISSFAFELEDFSQVEDWAPRNFPTRLMHLLRTAVDSYEKGYHSHYFTKVNVLRGIWKNGDHFETEEKSALRELDNVTEDLDDYGERRIMEIDDLEDDFGLNFDELNTFGDDMTPRLTSETIYKSLNPFETMENIASGGTLRLQSSGSKKTNNTLSKMFGSNLVRKISNKVSRRHSDAGNKQRHVERDLKHSEKMTSLTDIASGFEESIAQMRRQESVHRPKHERNWLETTFAGKSIEGTNSRDDASECVPGTSGSTKKSRSNSHPSYETCTTPSSAYAALLQMLNELPPSDFISDREMVAYLEQSTKVLNAQEELIASWGKAMNELPMPKVICPHVFSPRQIQYLALVIQSVSRSSPNMVKIVKLAKLPVWEISGDILRTVLHQMRTEASYSESLREKQRPKVLRAKSFASARDQLNESDEKGGSLKKSVKKFSLLRKTNQPMTCKHTDKGEDGFMRDLPQDEGPQLALEEPETAATLRLLEWLWQLQCSEIGRLSSKAQKYMEELFKISMINSHFLEQFYEENTFKTMALRSALAVTRIMADESFPLHVPLYAATTKGWLWAEMILSLAAWNKEKGLDMNVCIPLDDPHPISNHKYIIRNINATSMRDLEGTLKRKSSKLLGNSEPDIDAATLAFHSEVATPLGWNDFEDPRRSGPYTAVILIFSSMQYYRFWEMIPGNIVQALVRLQKFNSLQHAGNILSPPHRKTALNEVRKLNKSLSFRMYNFEENVMSKTFKRLASLRNTKQKKTIGKANDSQRKVRKQFSCDEAGCNNNNQQLTGVITRRNGTLIECTRL